MYGFKTATDCSARLALSQKIIHNYPGYYPVLIQRKTPTDPEISKNKFIVHGSSHVISLISQSKSLMKLSSSDFVTFFVQDNIRLNLTSDIKTVYDKYKNQDGFLYVYYTSESAFG